nr:DUF2127 domain-containing protein [Verrucomicrobium spinosum]
MSRAIKIVAAVEACKGLAVLLAATAVLTLVHKDLHALAVSLVEHLHLNPASKYPQILVLAADDLQNTRMMLLAAGAVAYAALRFTEPMACCGKRLGRRSWRRGAGRSMCRLRWSR